MNTVTLTLGHHDFLFAIEGFARGSHLRQHVWRDIVFANIHQMDDDFLDFLWFYMRRDIWPLYEPETYSYNGAQRNISPCGREDFIHCMAAIHRGNRYMVTFRNPEKKQDLSVECYRYDRTYHPVKALSYKGTEQNPSFDAFIPEEWVISAEYLGLPENSHVELGKEEWWGDIQIYNS